MMYLFYAIVISLVFLIGSSVWSILVPERRTWPPLRRSGFIYRVGSVLGPGISISLFVLPVLDWNSFVLEHWLRFPVGSLLLIVGAYFSVGGVFNLGMERTNGQEGELMEDGPAAKADSAITAGARLVRIDGVTLNATLNTAALLNRRAGKRVLLTFVPKGGTVEKQAVVEPVAMGAERQLLYRRWVLRKTWGYHAYKSGAPLAVIQRKLGHRRPSVTLDYLGLTDDDVQEWSERIDL